MSGMSLAKLAVFFQFQTVGYVLFVFCCGIIALFALSAGQSNCYTHILPPPVYKYGARDLSHAIIIYRRKNFPQQKTTSL